MAAVSIIYNLGQHGWSSFKLIVDNDTTDIGTFGYCTDALGDLVRAALLVATSALRAEVRFDGEPVEWRLVVDEGWRLREDPPGLVRLRILMFDSYGGDLLEAEGEVVFQAYVGADDFARAVQKVAQAIWDERGAYGYDEAWNGPNGFPLRGLRALDAALAERDPTARKSLRSPGSQSKT